MTIANCSDVDNDGRANLLDNCPWVANATQLDGDGDGRGDACDNCPGTPNVAQLEQCLAKFPAVAGVTLQDSSNAGS